MIEVNVDNSRVCEVKCLCCQARYLTEVGLTEIPVFCDRCQTPCLRVLSFDVTLGDIHAN